MKNSYFLIIVGLAVLIIIMFFGNPYSTKLVNYPPKSNKIVAFGDSLIVGKGSTEGNDFISLLSKKINKPIINMGVSGSTSGEALLRVNEVLLNTPGTVIILFGGNDYIRNVPKEETFKNLKEIISAFQSNGIFVVLLGVRGGIIKDNYKASFEDLSKEMGTAYVPDVLSGIVIDTSSMSDIVHPNDVGYKKIAEKVYDEVGKYLK